MVGYSSAIKCRCAQETAAGTVRHAVIYKGRIQVAWLFISCRLDYSQDSRCPEQQISYTISAKYVAQLWSTVSAALWCATTLR